MAYSGKFRTRTSDLRSWRGIRLPATRRLQSSGSRSADRRLLGPAGCSYPLPPLKVTSVITSPGLNNPTLGSPGFWLGDSQSPNFYKLDFASGTPTTFSANGPINIAGTQHCTTCATITGIQGLGVYDSEGANQPGLAKLLFNTSNTATNNETGYFPSSTANATTTKNSLELTLYNGTSPAANLGPFAMYASAVSPLSCFDDSTGNPPCLGTFQPGGTGYAADHVERRYSASKQRDQPGAPQHADFNRKL